MEKRSVGFILLIGGIFLALYGITYNNSAQHQAINLLNQGAILFGQKGVSDSRGTICIVAGLISSISGIGLLIVGNNVTQTHSEKSDDVQTKPLVSSKDSKTCPQCAETIKIQAKICRFCGKPFTESEIENSINEAKDISSQIVNLTDEEKMQAEDIISQVTSMKELTVPQQAFQLRVEAHKTKNNKLAIVFCEKAVELGDNEAIGLLKQFVRAYESKNMPEG